jgi:hypothetical protein
MGGYGPAMSLTEQDQHGARPAETRQDQHAAGPDQTAAEQAAAARPAGAGDFEFFVGCWEGRQRRLRKPLAGCADWEEFTSVSRCWSLFGGAANVDEVHFRELGVSGVTLRLLDVASGQWSIYWASSRNGLLVLPPVVGSFAGGVGRFYSEEDYEGTAITCRFLWADITPDSARWEQAFSADGRRTWETNWIADFTRRG